MGSCSSNESNKIPPRVEKYVLFRQKKFQYISDINCQYNVNQLYSHIVKIDRTATVNTGIKKTQSYNFIGSPQQLQKNKKQFWETRTNGSNECWKSIRKAILAQNENQAMQILRLGNVFLYKENMQICYDKLYNQYQIPIFCINQPQRIIQKQQLQNCGKQIYDEKDIQVSIRCTKFPMKDYKVNCSLNTKVQFVKSSFKQGNQIKQAQKIRLFFNGREMLQKNVLGHYGCFNKCVIQGMLY